MKREGTVPLGQRTGRVPPLRPTPPRTPRARAPAFEIEHDDDWVEGRRSGLSASARRRVRGTPLATLDLHRHDVDAARRRVTSFLVEERANGRDLVLVVVGRGRHSPGGEGVLRREIVDWLTTMPLAAYVLAFRTAPRELGGGGGMLVLLARP